MLFPHWCEISPFEVCNHLQLQSLVRAIHAMKHVSGSFIASSNNFYIQKSNTEIKRKSFSRIGAKLWNGIPTKLRALPKATFKKKIKMILLNILENEDSYKDLESIISKVNFYSS